jgi:hypothetical protein
LALCLWETHLHCHLAFPEKKIKVFNFHLKRLVSFIEKELSKNKSMVHPPRVPDETRDHINRLLSRIKKEKNTILKFHKNRGHLFQHYYINTFSGPDEKNGPIDKYTIVLNLSAPKITI